MEYVIDVVCSTYQRCRLRVCFQPGADITTLPWLTDDSYTALIDVSGDTQYAFSVPFCWPYLVAPHSTGMIWVFLESSLVASSTTTNTPVDVIVWARGGPDLKFCKPVNTIFVPVSAVSGTVEPHSMRDAFTGSLPSLIPDCASLAYDDARFADHVTHVSDLTHLPEPFLVRPSALTARAVRLDLLPTANPTFVATAAGVRTDYAPTVDHCAFTDSGHTYVHYGIAAGDPSGSAVAPTYLDHFAATYKASRGSLRALVLMCHRAVTSQAGATPAGLISVAAGNLCSESAHPIAATPASGRYLAATQDYSTLPDRIASSVATVVDPNLVSSVAVELPMNSSEAYVSTGSPVLRGPLSLSCSASRWLTLAAISSLGDTSTSVTPTNQVVAIFRSAGDDFRFHFIRGAARCYKLYSGIIANRALDIEGFATRPC